MDVRESRVEACASNMMVALFSMCSDSFTSNLGLVFVL